MDSVLSGLIISAFGTTSRPLTLDEITTLKAIDFAASEIDIIDSVAGSADEEPVCEIISLHSRSPEDRGLILNSKGIKDQRFINVKAIWEVIDPPKPKVTVKKEEVKDPKDEVEEEAIPQLARKNKSTTSTDREESSEKPREEKPVLQENPPAVFLRGAIEPQPTEAQTLEARVRASLMERALANPDAQRAFDDRDKAREELARFKRRSRKGKKKPEGDHHAHPEKPWHEDIGNRIVMVFVAALIVLVLSLVVSSFFNQSTINAARTEQAAKDAEAVKAKAMTTCVNSGSTWKECSVMINGK